MIFHEFFGIIFSLSTDASICSKWVWKSQRTPRGENRKLPAGFLLLGLSWKRLCGWLCFNQSALSIAFNQSNMYCGTKIKDYGKSNEFIENLVLVFDFLDHFWGVSWIIFSKFGQDFRAKMHSFYCIDCQRALLIGWLRHSFLKRNKVAGTKSIAKFEWEPYYKQLDTRIKFPIKSS